MTNNKTLEFITKVDTQFNNLKLFLEGEKIKETSTLQTLKKALGNYKIRNYDCFTQAESCFKIPKKNRFLYQVVINKIHFWITSLQETFLDYEERKKEKVQQREETIIPLLGKKVYPEYPFQEIERQIVEYNLNEDTYI